MAKLIPARVLQALSAFGAEVGDVLHAAEDTIKSLFEAGYVDHTPEAVAYAQSQGAKVVKLGADDSAAAEQLGAALTEDPATPVA